MNFLVHPRSLPPFDQATVYKHVCGIYVVTWSDLNLTSDRRRRIVCCLADWCLAGNMGMDTGVVHSLIPY